MSRYERIIFIDGDEGDEPLEILDEQGEQAAKEYLMQWHYPGEHETADEPSYGTADDVTEFDDGYIMSWNHGLGYIGLEFDNDYE